LQKSYVNSSTQPRNILRDPLSEILGLKPTYPRVHMHDEHAGIDFIGTFDFVYLQWAKHIL